MAAPPSAPHRRGGCLLVARSVVALAVVGCGAGTPLLHPAHVLERHRVRVGAGASQHLVFGPANDAIDRSQELGRSDPAIAEENREAFVEGALAQAVGTPALAPWVGARAGLGQDNEMGLSYTGRRVRGDFRHAFQLDQLVFSVGGGLGAILPDLGSSTPRTGAGAPERVEGDAIRRFDGTSISGWTVDVPLLLGTRSRPDVVSAWFGGHALYERYSAELLFDFDASAPPVVAPTNGSRFFAGAVAGLSVGLRPVWAMIEVSGGYQSVSAEVNVGPSTYLPGIDGFTLTPSFALAADLD
jgi:hypothetical protein